MEKHVFIAVCVVVVILAVAAAVFYIKNQQSNQQTPNPYRTRRDQQTMGAPPPRPHGAPIVGRHISQPAPSELLASPSELLASSSELVASPSEL
jgi:hypothetical protein